MILLNSTYFPFEPLNRWTNLPSLISPVKSGDWTWQIFPEKPGVNERSPFFHDPPGGTGGKPRCVVVPNRERLGNRCSFRTFTNVMSFIVIPRWQSKSRLIQWWLTFPSMTGDDFKTSIYHHLLNWVVPPEVTPLWIFQAAGNWIKLSMISKGLHSGQR